MNGDDFNAFIPYPGCLEDADDNAYIQARDKRHINPTFSADYKGKLMYKNMTIGDQSDDRKTSFNIYPEYIAREHNPHQELGLANLDDSSGSKTEAYDDNGNKIEAFLLPEGLDIK